MAVSRLAWLMWGVATLFFAYQFIMRLTPGLVMPELMQKFQINATDYGLFAAIYYFAYSGLQIPVAILLDRFGPKYVIAISAFICSAATLMLVYADHWVFALMSRLFIGAGSAAGFLGASKIITTWFPEKMYTRMVGLTFTFGLLGAVYGGKPVGTLITKFGWMEVLSLVGWVGVSLSLLIAVLVKSETARQNADDSPVSVPSDVSNALNASKDSLFQNIKSVLGNKKLIILALANFLLVGSLEGFADVWGVPYLVASLGMQKSDAAQIVSCVFVGMLFGGPILAFVAEKIRSNYWVTMSAGLFMSLLFVLMLCLNHKMPVVSLYALLFLVGIFCCYQVIVFAIGVELVPKNLSSITVAFLNCVNMLGGSFYHSLIGNLMDMKWNGVMENGVRVYDAGAYTHTLMVIPVGALLGAMLLVWIIPRKVKFAVKAPVM